MAVEARVGHPGEMLSGLKERIQAQALTQFGHIEDDWLDLMWSLDAYRVAGIPPRGMGKLTSAPQKRLEAVYRSKGNWFAELLALLLEHRTSLRIAPRQSVQGFSQAHQIDVAWPARAEDPLVCAETKVTGAPAYGTTPARGATSDWTNRRKELKFAATDLKLYRRAADTTIDHWGVWRESAPPKTYFLWAARLRPTDRLDRMVREAQALVNTYLDGAGIYAWQENEDGDGYQAVSLPPAAHVTDLDDVLHRIASEINRQAGVDKEPPPPVTPEERVVEPEHLLPDED
ncbi:MAG: hypothetical protein WD689_11130 [Gaiellaceae bacterium]